MAGWTDLDHFTRDLSVGRKLALGFGAVGIVVIALVASMFIAINGFSAAAGNGQAANERHDAARSLQHAAAAMRASQLSYVAGMGEGRQEFESSTRDFEQSLDQLREHAMTPVEDALIVKIATGYQTFLSTDQFVWVEVQAGNHDVARNLTLGAASLDFGFMAADADLFAEQALFDQTEANERIAREQDEIQLRAAAMGVLAVTLVAGASWYITGRIRDPLLALQGAAEQAADGDLTAVADVHGDDETGRLAHSFNTMLRELRSREQALLDEHRKQQRAQELQTALELASTEEAVFGVVERALDGIAPERGTELLLAQNSRSHFKQAAVAGPDPNGPGCGVPSPYACPAVRAGKAMSFFDATALDSCPHLADRAGGPCSAVCTPVSFMGRSVGVLHSTGPNGTDAAADVTKALVGLADATGDRIGVLRSTARTQLHATTDGLTGLPNRRTFESRARAMHRNGEPFTLVMADLDHFKLLNDTYGHEAGDRALRLFSEVMLKAIREGDAVSRWGGEEFTIAFVDTNTDATEELLTRLARELAAQIAATGNTPFTASFGFVDAAACPNFETAIRLADGALYEAKANGRAQAVRAQVPNIHMPPLNTAPADPHLEDEDHVDHLD